MPILVVETEVFNVLCQQRNRSLGHLICQSAAVIQVYGKLFWPPKNTYRPISKCLCLSAVYDCRAEEWWQHSGWSEKIKIQAKLTDNKCCCVSLLSCDYVADLNCCSEGASVDVVLFRAPNVSVRENVCNNSKNVKKSYVFFWFWKKT